MSDKQAKKPTHKWAKDQDYWDKLTPAEREWLKQFNSEYYHGDFSKRHKRIHPEHFRQDCVARHNSMGRDAMAVATFIEDGALSPPQDDVNLEEGSH